ncbi:hypothetical protein [Bartonella pachyuromydis]|uniref:Uncharacterized protein n=1 Tax=Bartonella pachyuromydis TaxID=931097 RepID=A0ABP8VLP5_9HYPH
MKLSLRGANSRLISKAENSARVLFLIKTSILKNRCLDTVFDLKYSNYSFAKNQ